MMKYFLIYAEEGRFIINQFDDKSKLPEYIKKYLYDIRLDFLDYMPEDLEDCFCYNNAIVIKGDIVVPKPIEIVKSYDIV